MSRNETTRKILFFFFSVSAGIIELVSFTLFEEVLRLPHWGAYLGALVLSVLWNFTLNRRFTFQSASNVTVAMLKVLAYYAVFAPLSTGLEYQLTAFGWNEYLVTLINMAINLVTEYIYQRYFVFGKSIDTRK